MERVQASDVTADDDHRQVLALAVNPTVLVEDKRENWLLLQGLLLDTRFPVQVAQECRCRGSRHVSQLGTQPDLDGCTACQD